MCITINSKISNLKIELIIKNKESLREVLQSLGLTSLSSKIFIRIIGMGKTNKDMITPINLHQITKTKLTNSVLFSYNTFRPSRIHMMLIKLCPNSLQDFHIIQESIQCLDKIKLVFRVELVKLTL